MELNCTVYTRRNDLQTYHENILTLFRVGYARGVQWAEDKMAGSDAIEANDYAMLFNMLARGRVDIVMATEASTVATLGDMEETVSTTRRTNIGVGILARSLRRLDRMMLFALGNVVANEAFCQSFQFNHGGRENVVRMAGRGVNGTKPLQADIYDRGQFGRRPDRRNAANSKPGRRANLIGAGADNFTLQIKCPWQSFRDTPFVARHQHHDGLITDHENHRFHNGAQRCRQGFGRSFRRVGGFVEGDNPRPRSSIAKGLFDRFHRFIFK